MPHKFEYFDLSVWKFHGYSEMQRLYSRLQLLNAILSSPVHATLIPTRVPQVVEQSCEPCCLISRLHIPNSSMPSSAMFLNFRNEAAVMRGRHHAVAAGRQSPGKPGVGECVLGWCILVFPRIFIICLKSPLILIILVSPWMAVHV